MRSATDQYAGGPTLPPAQRHAVFDPACGGAEQQTQEEAEEPSQPPGTMLQELAGYIRLSSTPALNRTSMAPQVWSQRSRSKRACGPSPDAHGRWHGVGRRRQALLALLVGAQTWFATQFMVSVLPYHGGQPLELAILVLFAILFSWVSAGFWTAIMGFVLLLKGRDRYAISASAAALAPIPSDARTALVMPICNEDVARVFAGLRATYESLARTGALERFDFFVLSDSSDPDARVGEMDAWLRMCRELKAFGRVFYRWRQHRIKRKSGNIADFCRRWGRNYRYMVVLDADSVMSGECLTTLVRLMEANPNAGIIQTAPRAAGRCSPFARIQQFANRVYGPVFVAGLHYFELGEAHYWGHNAIIRVAPFMEHCALARLPGRGSLSGEILSHDFVEAALMRRAGWAVWIAYDLPGSYEEMPSNLIDELKRDRRWCQGNLINLRLFWARGLQPAHRAIFLTGVMVYVSAPLWFLFLILSTALLAVHTLVEPQYFVQPAQLFPLWPQWRPERGVGLYLATATLLFLPKILAFSLVLLQGAREFGGPLRLALSMLAEALFSVLLAPVRMLFHTQFVLRALIGWTVHWKSPQRDDCETGWGEAFARHLLQTVLGAAWAGLVYWLNPAFLWWLLPVVGALVLSIPLSVYSSRVGLGRRLRRRRWFLIPEESRPPQVLRRLQQQLRAAAPPPNFVDAVVDPVVNASACGMARVRLTVSPTARADLVQRALTSGPSGTSLRDRHALLRDPAALWQLHQAVSSPQAHPQWHALDTERVRSAPKVADAEKAAGVRGADDAAAWPKLGPALGTKVLGQRHAPA